MSRAELEIMDMVKKIAKMEDCSPDMDLMEDIGLSSIEVMDLIARCEARFQIKISSRDLRTVYTLRNLAELVERKV